MITVINISLFSVLIPAFYLFEHPQFNEDDLDD